MLGDKPEVLVDGERVLGEDLAEKGDRSGGHGFVYIDQVLLPPAVDNHMPGVTLSKQTSPFWMAVTWPLGLPL